MSVDRRCRSVPTSGNIGPDPRFDRYRERVGRLLRGGDEVGLVLVLVEAYTEQVGGYLWWRRWRPTWDALVLWTIIDGQFEDHWVTEALDDELDAFDAGQFSPYGESLCLRWTDRDESARLRMSEFEQ
jgi:hypothetical protein